MRNISFNLSDYRRFQNFATKYANPSIRSKNIEQHLIYFDTFLDLPWTKIICTVIRHSLTKQFN